MIYMTVGEKIKKLRKSLGLTQTELGQRVGVQKNAVSKWECGRVEDIPTSTIKQLASLFGVPASYLIDDDSTPIPTGFSPMPETELVPRIGRIACGDPITAEENVEDQDEVLKSWHADFTLVCCGDSMVPKIEDGDVVAIRSQPTVENGEIAAVRIGDEATLKRVFLHPDYIELRPLNPEYDSIIRRREEMSDIRIEGLAVGLCRNL
jgi:repressor LexA|uniref:Repressor protein CI n=1 Tax=Podoviridae sp. ct90d35 TaxID=2827724 RepID=A0A8S5TNF2_9CAUD|nr:MAG TPA: Repressor protein CI [Podoviridae sp. ct90d35]